MSGSCQRSRSGCGADTETPVHARDGRPCPDSQYQPNFQTSGKGTELARTGLDTAARRYASPKMPDQRPAIAIHRLVGVYADDATEVQVHIGSVLLVIWLVIGGIAAGQRGDYKGPVGCSRASTIAVTILAGPFNYAGVNPNINCTVQHPSN